MPDAIERYLFAAPERNNEYIKNCLSWAVGLSQRKGFKTITLLFPAKNQFEGSVFADTLTRASVKALLKGSQVRINENIYLKLESVKTFRRHGTYEILFGAYLSKKGIDFLDSAKNVKAVFFLPWLPEEAQTWMDRWKPKIIGGKESQKIHSLLSPAVEKELEELTKVINLSTALSHKIDEKLAKDTFAKLKTKGEKLEPNDIKNWAIRNGWEPKHADKLAKLASKNK